MCKEAHLYGNSLVTDGLDSTSSLFTLQNLFWVLRSNRLFFRTLGMGFQKDRSSLTFSTIPVLTNPVLERVGEAMAECSNLMSGKVKMVLELLHAYSDKVFVGVIRLW